MSLFEIYQSHEKVVRNGLSRSVHVVVVHLVVVIVIIVFVVIVAFIVTGDLDISEITS